MWSIHQRTGVCILIELDANDPFEAALIPIVETNRKKRKDYALDGDIFSNFSDTSNFAGFETRWMSALFNCSQKLSRITSLRANGRLHEPSNEAVLDTLLDLSCYAIIALAIAQQDLEAKIESADVIISVADKADDFDVQKNFKTIEYKL